MNLNNRLKRLEELLPPVDGRQRRPVPTTSVAMFARGLLAGDFNFDDYDRANHDQTDLMSSLFAYFVCISPDSLAWEERTDWARADRERYEQGNLAELTPDEMAELRRWAAVFYPPREPVTIPTEVPSNG